ncbi:MAG: branched-chain amino acid ABC transporter permease [Anaerolineae bacterium]|nr:branched-chain amino acid ABC transporter permease [Anaerolineae bacterium]
MRGGSRTSLVFWIGFVILTLVLPQFLRTGYLINALIVTVTWIIFALSFDLSAGHVGTVSLGHPVFFGLGAYVTALAAPALGLDYIGSVLLSMIAMGVLAFVSGIAFFRIAEVTFAIGTLGALIIAQLLANNAFEITGGPMCTQGVSRPVISFFGLTSISVTQPIEYYYLLLPLLFLTILVYRRLAHSRIGRAFAAVRQDEVRALALGINPMRYKLLAFAAGGALIGALGSFQAQYITLVCPSELALSYTLNLLIIVFVGGSGSFRGVLLGAIIFTVLPRILETVGNVPPAYQQLIYGIILLLVIRFLPDGLDSLIERTLARWRGRDKEVSNAA